MVRHIVLIKVSEEVSSSEVDLVFEKLGSLKDKIPGILNFYAGIENSPEGLARGYTHVFMLDFTDADSRDAYLPHPEHKAVQPPLMEILADVDDKVLVVDFDF